MHRSEGAAVANEIPMDELIGSHAAPVWSTSLYAQSLPAFQEGSHFVVNILAYDQIELSNKFARTHDNKFAEIDHMIPECGAPVLIGAAAHFECRNEYRHYGGDHIIFIGHVERYAYTGRPTF